MASEYNLTEVPARLKEFALLETDLKWSGVWPVPKIGDRVNINFNNLGSGIVESYFIEHDYLGVLVKLDNPPEWKQKQAPPGSKYHGVAHVFGAEIIEKTRKLT